MLAKNKEEKQKRPGRKNGEVQERIERDKKGINDLLEKLDTDKVKTLLADQGGNGELHTLRRYHNSVGISFAQLLAYSIKIPKTGMPNDIKFLLNIFREMAERFYTQYERSLLEDIKHQWDEQDRCKVAIEAIKGLSPEDTDVARERLAIHAAESMAEYERLILSFPWLLQAALDKLRDEWLRVSTIAIASQALTDNKNLIQTLEWVVEATAHYVGVEAERIVIVPGKEFSLYFFKYVENFAVLSVPIYSVQAPWEWSIFWHELAGYKVRRLEIDPTHDTLRKNLRVLYDHYCSLPDDEKDGFLYVLAPGSVFSRGYLKAVFSDELDLNDLGSFEHQFEQMLQVLPRKNRLQEYQEAKDLGWCVDWVKELFEDAWSVSSIDKPFLIFFKDILKRHTVKDSRHPPLQIRMDVGGKFLELRDMDYTSKSAMPMTESAARQLLKFMTLLKVGAHKPATEGTMEFLPDPRSGIFEMMKDAMKGAIEYWHEKLSEAEDPAPDAMDKVKEFTQNVSKMLKEEMAKPPLSESVTLEKNQIKATYEELLNSKDYKQLQSLSFFDVDFGFPVNSISNITFGKSIKTATKKVFTAINTLLNINLSGTAAITNAGGDNDITYTGPDGKTYHADLKSWNHAFASMGQYQLP